MARYLGELVRVTDATSSPGPWHPETARSRLDVRLLPLAVSQECTRDGLDIDSIHCVPDTCVEQCRNVFPAGLRRFRPTTTPGAGGPCCHSNGSIQSEARFSIRVLTVAGAPSTTRESTWRCAMIGRS